MEAALEACTVRNYAPAASLFLQCWERLHPGLALDWDTVSESDLMDFGCAMALNAKSAAVIDKTFAGLRHYFILNNYRSLSSFDGQQLNLFRKGIRNSHPPNPFIRLPISLNMLRQILQVPPIHCPSAEALNSAFRAACILGHRCLLRTGELAIHSKGDRYLRRRDVTLCDFGATLRLERTKTSNLPVTVPIFRDPPGSTVCPLDALLAAMASAVDQSPEAPLLQNGRGQPLRSDYLRGELKRRAGLIGLRKRWYNGYSLRIGGASEMAAAGASPAVIKDAGRWKSDAFLLYTRSDWKDLQLASLRVYQETTKPRFHSPLLTPVPGVPFFDSLALNDDNVVDSLGRYFPNRRM